MILTPSPTEYATATWSCVVVPNRPAAIEAALHASVAFLWKGQPETCLRW